MSRVTISEEQYEALLPLGRQELLAFIRERYVARKPGPKPSGRAMPASERVKRWRERQRGAGELAETNQSNPAVIFD